MSARVRKLEAYGRIVRRDPCSYCPGPGGTADHIEAVSLGGPEIWWNLTGACVWCNGRKSDMPLLRFLDVLSRHYDPERGRWE